MFYCNTEPCLKWNKIILKNFILTWNHVW